MHNPLFKRLQAHPTQSNPTIINIKLSAVCYTHIFCNGDVHEGGGGKDWEFGINRGKLLCIGWLNNKVLLYSTGNYI